MIWVFIIGLCVAVFVYIALPFYMKTPVPEDKIGPRDNEVSAYRNELKNIEKELASENGDLTALAAQKLILEKRLVSSATKSPYLSSSLKIGWMVGTFSVLIAGAMGLYGLLGSPDLTDPGILKPATLSAPQALSQNTPDIQHENNASMNDLVEGLERKLQAGDQNPQQWALYARSLMTLNRFEDAFAAYEKTLSLTDNNPDIAAELESARAFAAQQNKPVGAQPEPGPTREDMEAASQMSPEDRAAMIQGMVEGLSEKLTQNPDDPTGWVRLLRARKVLGQTREAEMEIIALKSHFEESPETIANILNQSGWNK